MPYSRRKSAPYKIGDFFNWKSLTSERLQVRREYEQVSQIFQQQCYRRQPKRDDNITVGATYPALTMWSIQLKTAVRQVKEIFWGETWLSCTVLDVKRRILSTEAKK